MALTVLLGTVLAGLGGCSGGDKEADAAGSNTAAKKEVVVDVVPVAVADVAESVELVGSLIPRRRSVIVSEVDGVIVDIPSFGGAGQGGSQPFPHARRLNMGIAVAKGDVVARLDPMQYQLRFQAAKARLLTAERELDNLRAWRRPEEIKQCEATRDEAAARVVLAESNLERARGLLEKKAISPAEFDVAEMEWKVTHATLKRCEAELALSKAGPTKEAVAVATSAVAQARAEVARAQWELDRTIIRAPFDGVITERLVDEGDRVTAMPRVEMMEIIDLSIMGAELGVAERYVSQIRLGDEAQIYVKGSVEPVPGMVGLINDKVDPASRTFRIRVAMRNDERRLKAGQFVRVVLRVDRSAMTLTVPVEAITYDGGEAGVFVCEGGRARKRPVVLGLNNGRTVEVLSGLAAGESVVVHDPSILSEGMAVRTRTLAMAKGTSASTR